MTARPSAAGPPDGDTSPFTVHLDLIAGRLELAGPLDRSTAHLLHDAISTLLLTDCGLWTIDVTELTACEGTGLRAIGIAYRRALRQNRRVRLVGTPTWLQRDLTRLHLDHHLLGGSPAVIPLPVPDVATAGREPDGQERRAPNAAVHDATSRAAMPAVDAFRGPRKQGTGCDTPGPKGIP